MSDAVVITVSDRVSASQAQDTSGPAVAELLTRHGFRVGPVVVVPDDPAQLEAAIRAGTQRAQLVVTTGGTGLGPRDRTPEVTLALGDQVVPGIAEEMRRAGLKHTPMAVLSRGLAVTVGRSLVINLPGSRAGAVQSLEAVVAVLPHAIDQLGGRDHARAEGTA